MFIKIVHNSSHSLLLLAHSLHLLIKYVFQTMTNKAIPVKSSIPGNATERLIVRHLFSWGEPCPGQHNEEVIGMLMVPIPSDMQDLGQPGLLADNLGNRTKLLKAQDKDRACLLANNVWSQLALEAETSPSHRCLQSQAAILSLARPVGTSTWTCNSAQTVFCIHLMFWRSNFMGSENEYGGIHT